MNRKKKAFNHVFIQDSYICNFPLQVNHFPGSGYITNKVSLAVNYFPFIPPAFVVPKDSNKFLEEVIIIIIVFFWLLF